MLHLLKPHPDTPCSAVTSIEVEIARADGRALLVRYVLTGRIDGLAIPAPAPSQRADDLWRRTCFEAFVRPEEGETYYEFNLSPSSEWAAYRLNGYREGLTPVAAIDAPRIEVQRTDDQLVLTTAINPSLVPDLSQDAPWRLGLSAVIETADGSKSYWALAHPPGKPDFHHPDCFALQLEAPKGS